MLVLWHLGDRYGSRRKRSGNSKKNPILTPQAGRVWSKKKYKYIFFWKRNIFSCQFRFFSWFAIDYYLIRLSLSLSHKVR